MAGGDCFAERLNDILRELLPEGFVGATGPVQDDRAIRRLSSRVTITAAVREDGSVEVVTASKGPCAVAHS